MRRLIENYAGLHQHMLAADGDAVMFYERLGFAKAGNTTSMWIYDGKDH